MPVIMPLKKNITLCCLVLFLYCMMTIFIYYEVQDGRKYFHIFVSKRVENTLQKYRLVNQRQQNKRKNWAFVSSKKSNETIHLKNHQKRSRSTTKRPSTIFEYLISKSSHSPSVCPENSITHQEDVPSHDVKCTPHKRSESGCKFAAKTYAYKPAKQTCDNEPAHQICAYNGGNVQCSYETCWDEENVDDIFIHLFNISSGYVEPVDECRDNRQLSEKVKKYAIQTVEEGFNFMFLSCGRALERTQLLLLDRKLIEMKTKIVHKESKKKKLNINFVLFDSVSRGHFYRSLKKTVSAFDEINAQKSSGEVLDFELFQAMHGHSAENNHALFTGQVFPKHLTDTEVEDQATGVDAFLEYFQKNGYEVGYQDDMCWEAFWGIRMDLGGARNWTDLFVKIKKLNLADTGLMFSSCKILELHHVDNIFNTQDDARVCYNGHQHDAYYLRYLINKFISHEEAGGNEKLLMYSNLNVAHDGGGIRIQTIDRDLSRFVRIMSSLKDTLTILIADHGNTYTDFVYVDMEGRYEMFHPSLFLIIPEEVRQSLGKHAMASLRLNQKRLVTMIDMHNMLFSLANEKFQNKGLLDAIPVERTCSDLPLRMPNLCVCDGWESPVKNTTELIGHVEFTIGVINNIIVKSSPTHRCKRLVPTSFSNVLQRKDGDYARTTFDFHTHVGMGSSNTEEKFNVEVESLMSGGVKNHQMRMLSVDRISKFGIYKKCSDAKETFRLCVCDLGQSKFNRGLQVLHLRTANEYKLFDVDDYKITEEQKAIVDDQLIILKRTYYERRYDDDDDSSKETEPRIIAVTFEIINLTWQESSRSFQVRIVFDNLDNMKPTTSSACQANVGAGEFLYLCTIVRAFSIWEAKYEYKIQYKEL